MKQQALDTELATFWHNQHLKLIANECFIDDKGGIGDDVFYFKVKQKDSVTALDFSVFELPHIVLAQVATLTLKGQVYPLSLKDYAKLTVVNNISPKNIQKAQPTYKMLVHIAAFLQASDSRALSESNIIDFHVSYLTQMVTGQAFSERLSPEAYRGTYSCFSFTAVRNKLQALGVSGILDRGLTSKHIESTLDHTCQTVMGMRLSEYKEGGSFNFLGLEMGQYYVDYMTSVYEANYFYALVCDKAIRTVSEQFDLYDETDSSKKTRWDKVLLNTIQWTYCANKFEKTNSKITRGKLHSAMDVALYTHYDAYFDKVQSLREDNINQLIKALGLSIRFDAAEVIRTLMLQKYYPFDAQKSPFEVWQGYLHSLVKTDLDSQKLSEVSADDVYDLMANIVTQKKQDKAAFMKSLSQWAIALMGGQQGKNITELTGEFERITAAMTSLMVAWLGYRKSEFGFPFSAIHVEPNLDILDNAHVPFRFKLKWLVPKTNYKVKIDREITSQCYQVAAQLHELFELSDEAPCLYQSTGANKYKSASNASEKYIELRVKANWFAFIDNYPLFNEVNELQELAAKDVRTLNKDEQVRLQWLSQAYDLSSARTQFLFATHAKLIRDRDKLRFTAFAGDKKQKAFKASLDEFHRTGCISNPQHKAVVETYLSEDTRKWLRSETIHLNRKSMMDISKELLQGVRYPTPHAFRHIWAEAVLTRYQGDVGAVIRHQFCHLDYSFFMAYLREKEPRALVKAARMKVLNSIVDTLLLDKQKIGHEYVGGFARYVRKAAQVTQVMNESEMRELRDRIAGRVISLQPSYFATCVPREGGESRAKCAEFGDINSHNAKPEFCLNCTNALITGENLKGIWLTLQPFVKESLNERVMGFMVAHHLPTLRSGYKRIKELRTDNNAVSVDKILSLTAKAIDSIEQKLKQEEASYA